MLVDNNEPQINFDSLKPSMGSKRRYQLFFALALLLAALALVVLKNRGFWHDVVSFYDPSSEQTMSDAKTKSEPRVNPATRRKASAKMNALPAAELAEEASQPKEVDLGPLQVDVTFQR